MPQEDKLELLLDFSRSLPALPDRLGEHPEELEQVVECQSPLFLTVEWEEGAVPGPGAPVRLFFSAPAEAPTTRGFASIDTPVTPLFEALQPGRSCFPSNPAFPKVS